MLDAVRDASDGLPPGVDAAIIGAVVVGVALAGIFAWIKGYGRDPLERLAAWAREQGLEYVAARDTDERAAFIGSVNDVRVDMAVRRVPGRRLIDLPPHVTTIAAGGNGADVTVVIQPSSWVLDREGRPAPSATATGDDGFDARWTASGDADAVAALVSAHVRARLAEPDAEGLVIELAGERVSITMPGVCTDARELARRLSIVTDLARAIA